MRWTWRALVPVFNRLSHLSGVYSTDHVYSHERKAILTMLYVSEKKLLFCSKSFIYKFKTICLWMLMINPIAIFSDTTDSKTRVFYNQIYSGNEICNRFDFLFTIPKHECLTLIVSMITEWNLMSSQLSVSSRRPHYFKAVWDKAKKTKAYHSIPWNFHGWICINL